MLELNSHILLRPPHSDSPDFITEVDELSLVGRVERELLLGIH